MGAIEDVFGADPAPAPQRSALDAVWGAAPPAQPEPPRPLIEKPELPPDVQALKRQGEDLRSALRFDTGLDTELQGNYPAKAAAMRERDPGAGPVEQRSYGRLALDLVPNALRESRDILTGLGTAMVRGARSASDLVWSAAGAARTRLRIPGPDGTLQDVTLPVPVEKLDPDVKAKLVAQGARFGPDEQPTAAPTLSGDVSAVLERRGLAVPNAEVTAKYGDRVAIPIPGTDRSVVPRKAAEFVSQNPVSAALDASLVASVPGIVMRGAGEAAIRTGSALERVGFADAGGKLAQAGVAAQETGEALREFHPLSITRAMKDDLLARTEIGRERLLQRDAGRAATQLVNREADRSIARRIADQRAYEDALRPLDEADRARVVELQEGRSLPLPNEKPEVMNAARVVRDMEVTRRQELIGAGVLGQREAADRALGPWVQVLTGKRIAPREWDAAKLATENARARAAGQFEYLTPAEHDAALTQLRSFQSGWNAMPDRPEFDPAYFPRFPTGGDDAITLRKIASEFFPNRGRRPGRQAFQKHYSGLSFLENADPADVRQALIRYNAQARRVIDSDKIIRNILDAEIDVRGPGGQVTREKIAKPLRFDRDGKPINLLPGYRPYAPDGMLQFYRAQADMAEAVAKQLDGMGSVEQAIANGVRNALPKGLTKEWMAVRKRRTIYQVPESFARQIERHFGETHPALRVWDKATDAWKATVLAYSPRWYINNLVGNTVMGVLAGGNPARLLRPISKAEERVLPVELGSRTLAKNEGYVRDLGQARTSLVGAAADAVSNMRGVQMAGRVTDWLLDFNSLVDNHFRSRIYLDLGRREARNALVKRTGRAYFTSREVLEELGRASADPKRVGKLLDSVDRVFVNFNNLSPFERNVVRRIVPFWSWYREIARVTLGLPKSSPVRAQMARALSGMAQDADDAEFEKRVGYPKAWLREHLETGGAFLGADRRGEGVQMSTQGINPFADALTPEVGKLHPVANLAVSELFGGRTLGGFGSYVPFRTLEGDADQGEGPRPGFPLRVARTMVPYFRQLEDVAQQATEGMVSQRYEDVSPIANVVRQAFGKPIKPTYVYDFETREPRRVRPLADTGSAVVGIPLQRFHADEELEQATKAQEAEASRWARESWREPADRAALERATHEHAGERYDGMRTFRPN